MPAPAAAAVFISLGRRAARSPRLLFIVGFSLMGRRAACSPHFLFHCVLFLGSQGCTLTPFLSLVSLGRRVARSPRVLFHCFCFLGRRAARSPHFFL